MITIQVKVTGHELSLVSSPILSSDSIQFDRINFQFDSNWDGFNKVALFWGGDSDTPYGALVDENNNATIPAEVIAEKGTIRFGVYGEDPDDLRPRITSTILKYKVREGTWSDAIAGDDELTETLIDQLKEIAYAAYGNAEQFIDDAQEYLTQARAETAQNIAQNNAAVAANIQQNNAAVAANIQQNNAAITEYIADARETTQEYLDEVTEMAEGAKDSAKVAAQAAIDAAAPSLSYTVLFEYTSGPKILSALGDTLTINNIDEYDYIEFIFRDDYSGIDGTSSPQHKNITSLKLPLIFDNNNEMEFCLEQNTPEFTSPDYNLDSFQHNVIKINKNNHTLTVVEAFGSYVGSGSNVGNVCGSGRVSGTNAWTSTINIIKIIGWKYASIASKDVAVHDPELLDVRIGTDGTIYASAGDAVRGQIEEAEEIAFASYPARETSGATVSFLDGGDNAPVKELEVDISSVSGVTGASIERLGKNLANISDNTYTNSGITFTVSDGAVQMAGTSTATINRTIGTVKLLAGVTYAISGTKSSNISDADVLRVDLRTSGGSVVASGDSYNGFTYTPNADTNAQVNIRLASGQTLDITIYPQIEIGSIATEFEPYSPTVYTVDWTDEAGSIQSGTWDVLDGKLTVNGTAYDVTPVDVRTLLGSNTFSADCGDISMVYRADPALSLVEKYEKPSTGIPKTDLAADVQTSLGKADTALQSAPVTSVAGKTGAVTLDGGDIGYSVGSTYSSGTVGKSLQNTENGLALLQQTVDQLGGDKIPFDFSGYVPSEESIADVVNEISDDVADLKSQMGAKASTDMALGAYPTDSASGGVASFSDGADSIPVKDLTIGIEPIQSGSGDPSPTNVRPISGWTGANVTRTGKNLLNKSELIDGYVQVSDGNHISVTWIKCTDYLRCVSGLTIHSRNTCTSSSAIRGICFYDKNKNFISGNVQREDNTNEKMYAVPSNAVYFRINVTLSLVDSAIVGFDSVEGYTQYQSEIYPITFPTEAGTVYGGTLDVTTGLLTVTHGYIASYSGESLPGKWISSIDVYSAGGTPTTGAQVVYELATPQTYQLTPVEIEMLRGDNNVWADTGDSTVTYRADPTLYADKRSNATCSIIAGIEPTMTASKAYTVGQLLIVGDTLYKVAASIASGATLTPGTNVNPTTVAEQLILLANA